MTIETTRGKISGSHVLVATGQRANIDRLELDKAGVELTGADHAPHIKPMRAFALQISGFSPLAMCAVGRIHSCRRL